MWVALCVIHCGSWVKTDAGIGVKIGLGMLQNGGGRPKVGMKFVMGFLALGLCVRILCWNRPEICRMLLTCIVGQ